MTHHRKQQLSPELALASDVFDTFCRATTLKTILGNYRYLCELLDLKPTNFPHFYPKLKSKLCSWRAQALWNKFDKRANHKCYNRGKACSNTRVLIIGAGPCGLRTAIEAQLLGAKVVIIEKRDRMTRNNVLHLWPFVIHDLRALGAKKFFGKFCAGSIDHISIRQLQCILLKVALLLGVEIHEKVSFDSVLPPSTDSAEEKSGWRAQVHPLDHPVSQYEFDVLIGADGKRNTLEGFKRKEFRGKLAIAITANFINHHSEAEARVEEISGVAYIFNQKFFKDLYSETGIDLENIVYYKDETHYFVMTAKKHSLLNKGVILNDYADTAKLLALDNVNRDALLEYAKEAANFSTNYKLPELQFAINHCGQPDVAMFDFTSMYAAENASRIVQITGHKLLMCLVGDSLLEPFWPTGSGCARGFLSSMDACWSLRSWNNGCGNPLEVLAERESIYRLLAQTTPENLSRDTLNYTLDPRTRYPNLNLHAVSPIQVTNLFSTDDPQLIEHYLSSPFLTTDYHKKRRKKDFQIHQSTLLTWLKRQVALYNDVHIEDTNKSFKNGLALCAIIHHYRPDLIDFNSLNPENSSVNNQIAFDILEKEYGICPIATGTEMENSDIPNSSVLSYLIQVYNAFKGDIPHIRYLQMDNGLYKSISDTNIESITNSNKNYDTPKLVPSQKLSRLSKIASSTLRKRYHRNDNRSSILSNRSSADSSRRSRKRKSTQFHNDKDVKGMQEIKRIPIEGDFSNRVKDIENKLKGNVKIDKKPNDLYRSIGKIEKTDWNVKEIEKKIEENKFGRGVQSKVEKVPKWSREQFDDKYLAVKQKLTVNENKDQAASSKYANIDQNLKLLDWKLRNGTVLEQGQRGANKVSAMAAQLAVSNQASEDKPVSQKSAAVSNQITFGIVNSNEVCHFCSKRVYLMERLTAEGKFFHRGCFRCEYCSTLLRLGNYCFDRDGIYGSRFYCVQHFKLPSTSKMKLQNRNPLPSKGNVNASLSVDDKTDNEIIALSKMDTTDTPERIEFENLDIDDEQSGNVTRNEMDEDEWTDHNFGTSANELASSNEMSDFSDDSDDEYRIFAPALNHPPGDSKTSVSNFGDPYEDDDFVQPITDSMKKSDKSYYKSNHANSNSSNSVESNEELTSNEFDSEDDNSDTATECEADIKARELRMQEVRLEVPKRISHSDTGSDTEVLSEIEQNFSDTCSDDAEEEEYTFSISSDEESATEISTDSEFERNNTTVIRSEAIPDIIITESAPVRKSYLEEAKKVLIIEKDNVGVTSPELANPEPERKLTASDVFFNESVQPINPVQCPTALINPRKGDYYLNRTQSTEGIASKISLELKKKYLLGEVKDGNDMVKKSESTTRLDTEFKSFIEKISKHQKLLNPAPEPSLAMQAFLEGANKLRTTAGSSLTSLLNVKPVKELDGVNEFQHICKRTAEKFNGNADGHDYHHHRQLAQQSQENEIDDKEETLKFQKMLEAVNLNSITNDSAYNTVDEGPQSSSFSSANMATEAAVEKVLESLTNNGELLTSNEYNGNDNFIIKTARNGAILETAGTVEDNLFKSYSDSSSDMCNKIIAVPLLERNGNDSNHNASDIVQQQQHDKAQILKHVSTPSGLFQPNNSNNNNINSNSGNCSNTNNVNGDDRISHVDAAVSDNLTGSDINLSGSDDKSCSYSSPTSIQGDESTLAVFTETELSDWARDEDGTASENCFDDFDTRNITYRRHQKSSATPEFNKRATLCSKLAGSSANFERYVHVCGREDGSVGKEDKWSASATPTTTLVGKTGNVARSLTLADMDNIEFMDTADGDEEYTSSPSEDDANEAINKMLIENSGYIEYVASDGDEAKTPLAENSRSGFCVLHRRGFGNRLNSVDLHANETTATVRPSLSTERPSNTVGHLDVENHVIDNTHNCIAVTTGITDKTNAANSSSCTVSQPSTAEDYLNSVYDNSAEYDSFIHRLQGRISPFSNVKDSIDIRKARKQQNNNFKLESAIEFVYPNAVRSSSSRNTDATNDICQLNCRNTDRFDDVPLIDDCDKPITARDETSSKNCDSDELSIELSREIDSPVFIDEAKNFAKTDSSAANCTVQSPSGDDKKSNDTDSVKCSAESSLSLPDIRRAIHEVEEHLIESNSKEDIIKSVEQLRLNARIRARLMSDSELKISPDEKFLFLKERILSRKGVRSAYQSLPESYSVSCAPPKYSADDLKLVPSSPGHEQPASPTGKSERKKGIIQAVSNFFNKKISVSPTSLDSTSNQSTSKLMRFIPLRGKEKSKEKQHSTPLSTAVNVPSSSTQEMKNVDSFPISVNVRSADNTMILNNGTLDEDTNKSANSTLKQNKSVKKERQEHLKRLRMAQEIQRQLEELEVKQKELELRGVSVEKALCGENMENVKEESQLKNELLLLMEQRNELQRYECYLLARAQEIEQEDTNARQQK